MVGRPAWCHILGEKNVSTRSHVLVPSSPVIFENWPSVRKCGINELKNSGSGVVKAGFAGEEAPRSVFPCITGVPKEQSVMMTSTKNKYVGELAEKKR